MEICRSSKKYLAFTLIEILVVVGLIAILAAATIIAINPSKNFEQARIAEAESEIRQIYSALEQFLIDFSGYPSGVDSVYKEVCKSSLDRTTCESYGMVYLGDLVPDYVADLPVAPGVSDSDLGTGYEVKINGSNSVPSILLNSFVPSSGALTFNETNVVNVGSGEEYTTINAALTAITDNAEDNSYIIQVGPGTYNESIDIKPYVEVRGSGIDTTVLTNNAYASDYSSIRDLTIQLTGGVAWKAGFDAFSRRVANPCYIKNVKIYIDTNTGPVYPLLTKTGSYMEAHNVIIDAKQPPNTGDGLYAITHNAGSGKFYNLDVTLEIKSGSASRDDVGLVNTFWASNSQIYNSDITITNNATSNNTIDKILYTNSAASTRLEDSTITYTSATKSVGLFYPVSSANSTYISNVDANLTVGGTATTTYGLNGIIANATILDSTIDITKSGTGNVYGVRITNSNVTVDGVTVSIDNTSGTPVSYGLDVEASSPTIDDSDFTSTGMGTTYGGYVTTPTCNPTINNTDFFGTSTGLYLNTGCNPTLNNVTYNSIVDL